MFSVQGLSDYSKPLAVTESGPQFSMVNDPYLHTGGLCDIGVDQIYDERDVPAKERSGPGGGKKACLRIFILTRYHEHAH